MIFYSYYFMCNSTTSVQYNANAAWASSNSSDILMKMLLHYFKLIVVSVLLILYTYCFGITSIENFIKYGYFGTNCLIVAKNEEEIQDIPHPGDFPFLQH